jgi:hypothetical protein
VLACVRYTTRIKKYALLSVGDGLVLPRRRYLSRSPKNIFKKYTDLGRILAATVRYISHDDECGIIMNVGVSRPYNVMLNILILLLQWSRRYAYTVYRYVAIVFIFFKYITFLFFGWRGMDRR